jgi:hypothetical protein
MKPVLPFLIGGMNCQDALKSLEILMRNALVERTGFLQTVEDIKRAKIGHGHLNRRIRDVEDEVSLIELVLMLIPEARGGAKTKESRQKLASILLTQEEAIIERAEAYVNLLKGPRDILTLDIEFFKLLARAIEPDM